MPGSIWQDTAALYSFYLEVYLPNCLTAAPRVSQCQIILALFDVLFSISVNEIGSLNGHNQAVRTKKHACVREPDGK